MIKLININKYYKSSAGQFHALKDINLTLPDQGMVYIVGKSGSGKSTLLNIIGGIDNYDSGELIIDNTTNTNGVINTTSLDTANFSKSDYNSYRNTYIGFIFQEFNVIKGLTIYENIALSLELQQISVQEHHQDILDIIERVGLKGKENRRINEISGGERQRVAIARALIKDPKIIIADEPTGNLDSKNRDIVMNILKELSKEKLVLIVTHDKHLSNIYGDREITIKDGMITNDIILHQENLQNVVPTHHELKQITPKWTVSFNLAWKGFKLNKVRFILIIILFSISLIFAGAVINLYLTDTTEMYTKFQEENGNFVINLSNKYDYKGTKATTGFFYHNLSTAKKNFTIETSYPMYSYKSMQVAIPITRNYSESIPENSFWQPEINYITTYDNKSEIEQAFDIIYEDLSIKADYKCYITDYLADSLNNYLYYGETILPSNIIGKTIQVDGSKNSFTIIGIIQTNYYDFYQLGSRLFNDEKRYAAFEDNLSIYNSIFVNTSAYEGFYSSANITYYYDDILYDNNGKIEEYDDIKFTYINATSSDLLYNNKGAIPKEKQKGEISQVAVSKGFIEEVLKLNPDNVNYLWTGEEGKQVPRLTINGSTAYSFYLCGIKRIPASLEFNITGIIDSEELIIYSPKVTESSQFNDYIKASYIAGGFLTVKISSDQATNSQIYRNLLNNGITINNPSFKKLQLVDDFINDNIYLFAALFFVFCLFSILMIFNFIIINIKNSTRDIGIYMSLGMNGLKIALIYLFQVLIISAIAMVIGIIGSTLMLLFIDLSFNSQVVVNFTILTNTFLGVFGVFLLAFATPVIAIASPLFSLSRKKPIDVIKLS